jgi:hypothetical protein
MKLAVLGVAALPLAACGGSDSTTLPASYTIEEVAGTELSRITLTAKAAKRLDIQTAAVAAAKSGPGIVIPYAAVLYDTEGLTFAYVSPKPLTFVREEIVIDSIVGDQAFLSKGPALGTPVATVGVAELHGAETGLGAH